MLIQDKACLIPDRRGENATPGLAAHRDRKSRDEVSRRNVIATVLRTDLQLGSLLANGHYVDRYLSGFAMYAQEEPLFQEPLHHGAPHNCHALGRICSRIDRVVVRSHLLRKALDRCRRRGLVHEVGCAICIDLICLLDEAGKPPTGHAQSAGRPVQDGSRLRTIALLNCSLLRKSASYQRPGQTRAHG
jgi:hypothetical protein